MWLKQKEEHEVVKVFSMLYVLDKYKKQQAIYKTIAY
jgi:hypothetical protein